MGSPPSMYATVCEAMYFETQVSGVVTTAGKRKEAQSQDQCNIRVTCSTFAGSCTSRSMQGPSIMHDSEDINVDETGDEE